MASNASPVVETVSRKRIVPQSELAAEKTERGTPEFWDFLEKMTEEDWANGEYMLAISREDPKPSQYGGINQLEVITDGTMQVRPQVFIKINSREALHQGIRQKYGGKAFRLWLKRGKQRVTEGKCMNELPARMPMFDDNGVTAPAYFPPTAGAPMPNGSDPTASVANKAIDTLSQNQNPQLLNIAIDAVSRMAAVVGAKPDKSDLEKALQELMLRKLVDPPAPLPRTEDEIEKAFRAAMIARLTSDPFENFTKLKEMFQPPAKNSLQETLDFIGALKTSGLIGSTGHGGVWELAASALPHIAGAAKEVMHEWRLGMEAQERGVAVMRGANPAPHVVPPAQLPASNPTPQAPVNSGNAEPGGPQVITGDPPLEWVEQKIVDIFKKGETVDSTVGYVLDFLEVSYPSLIPLLLDPPKIDPRLKPGEEGLLMLFQNRPVLKQIPVNPRLTEFIKRFVALAEQSHGPAPDAHTLLAPEAPPPAAEPDNKPKGRNPRKPV